VTATACLSALGAVIWRAGGTNADPLMRSVPSDMRSAAWMLFGGTLSMGLYALVCLCHYDRAMQIASAVSQRCFGVGPESAGFAQMISTPAVARSLLAPWH